MKKARIKRRKDDWAKLPLKKRPIRLALDLRAGCSPLLETVVPNGTDLEAIVDKLNKSLVCLMKEQLGDFRCTLVGGEPEFSVDKYKTGFLKTEAEDRKERKASWKKHFAWLKKFRGRGLKKKAALLKKHPDNGKHGYWLITGFRHSLAVLASSATESVDKAKAAGLLAFNYYPEYLGERPDKIPLDES